MCFKNTSLAWDCEEPRLFVLVGVLSFHVFCKEISLIFLITSTF